MHYIQILLLKSSSTIHTRYSGLSKSWVLSYPATSLRTSKSPSFFAERTDNRVRYPWACGNGAPSYNYITRRSAPNDEGLIAALISDRQGQTSIFHSTSFPYHALLITLTLTKAPYNPSTSKPKSARTLSTTLSTIVIYTV